MRGAPGWSLAALVIAAGLVVQAQRPVLRSSIELTVVTATVRDGQGRLARDLPRDAFQVYEDGVGVPIAQFTSERVPLGLGLLLDISDSMFGRRMKDAEAAVEQFLQHRLAPTDAYFLLAFNHEPRVVFGWKETHDGLREALGRLRPTGATAIYDALASAMPYIESRPRERAAIVLVTDGADTASDLTLHELRPILIRADAFVYAIAIDTPEPQAIAKPVSLQTLNEITGQSGGRTEVVRSAADLDAATASIAEELNSQYVLAYSSPNAGDGKYHSIRVTVSREGHRVRARNGYVAARKR